MNEIDILVALIVFAPLIIVFVLAISSPEPSVHCPYSGPGNVCTYCMATKNDCPHGKDEERDPDST